MKEKLQGHIKEFLNYLGSIRGYSNQTILTYEIALRQMYHTSQYYKEEGMHILNITPFRLVIVKNHKKTILKKISAIRSLVKYLDEQCKIDIKLIGDERIKAPQSLPNPIEKKHITEVLSLANIEDKLIISMLYGLGLRISELANIKLENIQEEWIIIEGKGSKTRQLPVLKTIKTLILSYKKAYLPTEYLFEKDKIPLNVPQLRYKMTQLFKSVGIHATPHQLRHSFATHLLNNGARISDISELLGHESMATTQVYTKLDSIKKLEEYTKAHPLMIPKKVKKIRTE